MSGDASAVLRRRLGAIYILAGLLHLGLMALALLYSQGKIPGTITAALWSRMYFGHFLFLVMAGASLLFFSYRNTGLFFAHNLIEFAIGVGAFVILISTAGTLLAKGLAPAWISLGPGGFLVYYGLRLALK